MGITWYNDDYAKLKFKAIEDAQRKMVAQMFPGYELSHVGFNRNEMTEEVRIVLHINPIGRVRLQSSALGAKEPIELLTK